MSTAIETLVNREYQYGFVTDIEADTLPVGLSTKQPCASSPEKKERARFPAGLAAQGVPTLAKPCGSPTGRTSSTRPIDYQAISYYSAPKTNVKKLASLNEVDPELLRTYERLGIPLTEQKRLSGVAVDAIFDSVSVGTTMKQELAKLGIIFCSFGEAVQEHPELVRKYLGSSCRTATISSPRSTAPCSVMGRSATSPGRAVPDGAVDVFPHQRRRHGPVRAHADHRR